MQFGIRDLLVLTTIAAVYAAGMAYLYRLDGRQWEPRDFYSPLLMVASVVIAGVSVHIRESKKLGDAHVVWRMPNWWVIQLLFIGFFIAYIMLSTLLGESFGVIFPMVLAVNQFVFLLGSWIKLGENGVSLVGKFTTWSECGLRLDEAASELEYPHTGKLWTPRFPLERQRMPIPAENLEAVRALLAEKKPEAIASAGTSTH